MAAAQQPINAGDICPDPTAHGLVPARLQDQASKAALYVTHPERETEQASDVKIAALGPDGKLSSAGAAASLKHAQPHELPSFPSVGIDTSTSGNTAANLAHGNFKPFEHWKPGDLSSSAGKAALLAHKDGGKLDLWQPTPSDPGHTAAGAAMLKQSGLSPKIDYGYTDDGRKKALLAATLSVSGRARSESTPSPANPRRYPDAENAGHNALNAASVAHRPTVRKESPVRMSDAANEAARITHMQGNLNREMFTEHPPISIESEEERRRKSALKGATMAHNRRAEDAAAEAMKNPDPNLDPMTYVRNHMSLQEQAQKLAQERLSKLDPDGVLAYKEHYGYPSAPKRSRLSIRNRRTRSSSEGNDQRSDDDDDDDARRAGRIRNQMSRFNDQLASVDQKKRQTDRSTLMAAAEKSVKQRMSTLDQQIFDETGKVTPAVLEQWEAKARARAAEQSEKRLENHGMINVGGGKFMSEKEVEAIAASRMQPTLDEITTNAEKQRARDEEVRLDQERRREEDAKEKQRERENKAEAKKSKQEEKELAKVHARLKKQEVKQQAEISKQSKNEKDEQTARRAEVKTPTEEPKSAEGATTVSADAGASDEAGTTAKEEGDSAANSPSKKVVSQKLSKGENAAMGATTQDPPGVPTNFDGKQSAPHPEANDVADSPGSPTEVQTAAGPVHFKRNPKRDSRVRSWLGKLKRSSTKHTRSPSDQSGATETSSSVKGVDKEGKVSKESQPEDGLYSHYNEAEHDEKEEDKTGDTIVKDKGKGKDKASERSISPPTPLEEPVGKGESTAGDEDEYEEAKDKFDESDLKVPDSVAGRMSQGEGSPARTSSKFTEEL